MSQPVTDDQTESSQPALIWSVAKLEGAKGASITLGEQFADLDGRELTFVTHTIGESLIKLGTHLVQSRIDSGDYDEDEDW